MELPQRRTYYTIVTETAFDAILSTESVVLSVELGYKWSYRIDRLQFSADS